ncbi:hypothetical protein AHAS_Ahas15G0228800 [Arachis hypogaea]
MAASPPEMVVQSAVVSVSQQQKASLFVHHQHQQQQQAMGEASAARLGNYLPGHLNLLASKLKLEAVYRTLIISVCFVQVQI